jgi:hypothetical protein
MKTKLLLAIVAAASLPVAGIAAGESASDQNTRNAELDKLLTEMNTAPADQKIGAIVTLLNKLVEQSKAAYEQTQKKSMWMCCDMMKSDQNEHSHEH